MPGAYQDAGVEPSLEDLLADPIVELVLARDRIDPAELLSFLALMRERLRRADGAAPSDRPEAAGLSPGSGHT